MKTALKVLGIGIAAILIFIFSLVIFADHKAKNTPPPKPTMPVTVQHRPAVLQSSIVCIFKNTSNRTLMILATFTNPTLNTSKNFTVSMDPGRGVEFGYAQGWAFHSGDKILLHHADYSDASYSIQ
jgi:hypothetical protein